MRRRPHKSRQWADHYTEKAKKERLPARSVYKLREMQRKHRLIRRGDRILDLGCAPGSWLLEAAGIVGQKGGVVGVDLKTVEIDLPPNVKVLRGDVLDLSPDTAAAMGRDFDGVLSDMAPSTTGIRHIDSARSAQLCESALALACRLLKPGGFFVCKIFQGAEMQAFRGSVKQRFRRHSIFKPISSRKASKEIFIIGRDRTM